MIDDQEFIRLYNYYEPTRRSNYISIEAKVENLDYNKNSNQYKK